MELRAVEPGAYARKQIHSPSRLVRWSHGSRFELGRALVAPAAGGRLLDYGCGDGTFLALVHDLFPGAVGVDPAAVQVTDCARRLRNLPLTFTTPDALDSSHSHTYNVVTCMEVLEHCLEHERGRVIGELARLVRPTGVVVVSVPIEVGPSLVGKQVARALAAWRGLGDYEHRETYRPSELIRMVFARAGTTVDRPSYESVGPDGSAYRYYGHKGFDWRVLRDELGDRFTIERITFSPMPWLESWLNSQVWFICRSRAT
ncbi:MAG TPA: class I SAM-dependent methyltransferase [Vicinamibacterales bacterium]|nr:class I SAM-dependent methyltransferase [Vicinamibacterales bacterium]